MLVKACVHFGFFSKGRAFEDPCQQMLSRVRLLVPELLPVRRSHLWSKWKWQRRERRLFFSFLSLCFSLHLIVHSSNQIITCTDKDATSFNRFSDPIYTWYEQAILCRGKELICSFRKKKSNLSTCWVDFLIWSNVVKLYRNHLHLVEIRSQSESDRLQMLSDWSTCHVINVHLHSYPDKWWYNVNTRWKQCLDLRRMNLVFQTWSLLKNLFFFLKTCSPFPASVPLKQQLLSCSSSIGWPPV